MDYFEVARKLALALVTPVESSELSERLSSALSSFWNILDDQRKWESMRCDHRKALLALHEELQGKLRQEAQDWLARKEKGL